MKVNEDGVNMEVIKLYEKRTIPHNDESVT